MVNCGTIHRNMNPGEGNLDDSFGHLTFDYPLGVEMQVTSGQCGIQGRGQSWSCTFMSHCHITPMVVKATRPG